MDPVRQKNKSAWGVLSEGKKLRGKGGAIFSATMIYSSDDEEEAEEGLFEGL